MDNENARLRAARNAMVRTCTTTGGPSHEGERWVHWADYQALMDAVDAALTPAPEAPKGGEGENSGWAFDRYINGILMAEGVEVTRPMSFEKASILAAKLASRGPNGEVPVLVLRATPSPGADFKAGILRAAVDDVVCGRGMFGIDAAADLQWAIAHLGSALQAIGASPDEVRAEAEKITPPVGYVAMTIGKSEGHSSAPLTLRAGKRYRDGHGEVKGPLHRIHWENGEEMLTDSFQVWHPDGTLAGGSREDKRSLVAEVGDAG